MNRSADTVGAQNVAPSAVGSPGTPLAIRPAAAASSRIRPRRCSSIPVTLASRLASRTPRPPLRSSGTGAADSVSRITSTWRINSITAPAADASTSLTEVVLTTGSGAVRPVGPGSSPRRIWPTTRGSSTVSVSTWRSRPAASNRGTGRSAGVPGAASRVRPIGEPTTSRSNTSRAASSRSSSARSRSSAGADSVTPCPGYQGSAAAASGETRNSCSPHTRARVRRSSRAALKSPRGARSPISRSRTSTGTGSRSAPSTSRPSSTANRRKSRSSAAALIDCRDPARAARAAILPGAG